MPAMAVASRNTTVVAGTQRPPRNNLVQRDGGDEVRKDRTALVTMVLPSKEHSSPPSLSLTLFRGGHSSHFPEVPAHDFLGRQLQPGVAAIRYEGAAHVLVSE